jgi:hypothetical protein
VPSRGKDPAGYDLFFFNARLGFGGSSIISSRSPWLTPAVRGLRPHHQATGSGLELVGEKGAVQAAYPLFDILIAVRHRLTQKHS